MTKGMCCFFRQVDFFFLHFPPHNFFLRHAHTWTFACFEWFDGDGKVGASFLRGEEKPSKNARGRKECNPPPLGKPSNSNPPKGKREDHVFLPKGTKVPSGFFSSTLFPPTFFVSMSQRSFHQVALFPLPLHH